MTKTHLSAFLFEGVERNSRIKTNILTYVKMIFLNKIPRRSGGGKIKRTELLQICLNVDVQGLGMVLPPHSNERPEFPGTGEDLGPPDFLVFHPLEPIFRREVGRTLCGVDLGEKRRNAATRHICGKCRPLPFRGKRETGLSRAGEACHLEVHERGVRNHERHSPLH